MENRQLTEPICKENYYYAQNTVNVAFLDQKNLNSL